MTGKIVKGIAGFYYVSVAGTGIYECRAKGIFRKEKKKPLVGDNVRIEILDEAEKTGNLIEILPRKNELIRPAVANIDQAMVIFAMEQPKPNITLEDAYQFGSWNKADGWIIDEYLDWEDADVSWWMPLPTPPDGRPPEVSP